MKLINVKYYKKVRIKLKRTFPERGNLCKLSTYTNAMNHFGYRDKFGNAMTPLKLLKKINRRRKLMGRKAFNPNKCIIPYTELDRSLKETKLAGVKRVFGKKYLNIKLWKKLIEHGILIAPNHQQIYYPPFSNRLSLKHLPERVVNSLKKNKGFDYKKLLELYDFLIKHEGPIDYGHTDLVVDSVENLKEKYIVLANLNSINQKPYIKIPWNLYINYLAFDWEKNVTIKDISEFPTEKTFKKLVEKGRLPKSNYDFVFGMIDIFYPKDKEAIVNKLIK